MLLDALIYLFFFFSSRRRHTRSLRDWSSDVCSSDLGGYSTILDEGAALTQRNSVNFTGAGISCVDNAGTSRTDCTVSNGSGYRSEERRVGKEWRSRWAQNRTTKNNENKQGRTQTHDQ